MQKISADWIYPIDSSPLQNHVLLVEDDGTIAALEPMANHDPASVRHLSGLLVPGFVNTHCHLELSHMLGKAPTGTGLLPFLNTVVSYRDIPMEEILDAIEKADQYMQEQGIVAVGDISNKTDTVATKSKSPIAYYTFVEMFDFMQEDWAEKTFADYHAVYHTHTAHAHGNRKSMVPHAPYTVSKNLFKRLRESNGHPDTTISIHNQETAHENALFVDKSGDFLSFFQGFGISLDAFEPIGPRSDQSGWD